MARNGKMAYFTSCLYCVMFLTTVNTSQVIFEEESVTVHAGVLLDSTFVVITQAKLIIRRMSNIQFESDALQKANSATAEVWESFKKISIGRLENKFLTIENRIENILKKEPVQPQYQQVYNHDNVVDQASNTLHDILKREKRSIDFLGDALSYITGVPSPGEWRLNQENISHLKNALILLQREGERNNARLTKTNHHLGRLLKEMEITTKLLSTTIATVDVLEHDFRATLIYETMEKGLLQVLDSLESFLSGIDKMLIRGLFQKPTAEGIDPDFLKKAIIDIQSTHKTLTPIYGYSEISRYYDLPLSTITIHGNEIWTTMKIPMINYNSRFEKVIDSTQIADNLTELSNLGIKNVNWYMDKDYRSILLGTNTLQKCIHIRSTAVCNARSIILQSKFGEYGHTLENFWSESETEGYIAFINKENMTAIINCGKEKHIVHLPRKGQLLLHKTCQLKSDKITINCVRSTLGLKEKNSKKFHLITFADIRLDLLNVKTENGKKSNELEKELLTEIKLHENTATTTDNIDLEIERELESVQIVKWHLIGGTSGAVGVVVVFITLILGALWFYKRKYKHVQQQLTESIAKNITRKVTEEHNTDKILIGENKKSREQKDVTNTNKDEVTSYADEIVIKEDDQKFTNRY